MHACFGFAGAPDLQIDAAVLCGFFWIASGLLIQRCQPTVRCDQAGEHGEGGFECQGGAVAMAEAGEGYSQIKVAERKKVLKTDCVESFGGGFFVAAHAQVGAG
jgi:hypothetical protein